MNLFGVKTIGRDKVSIKKAELNRKLSSTAKGLETKINEELIENADNKVASVTSEAVGGLNRSIGLKAKLRRTRIQAARDKTTYVKSLIAEGVKDIVLSSLPFDTEATEKFNDVISENTVNFIKELLDENKTLSINKFLKNPSREVRLFTESLLVSDPDSEKEGKDVTDKIAGIVKAKTEKAIKDEIRNAEAANAIVPKGMDIPKVEKDEGDSAIGGAGDSEGGLGTGMDNGEEAGIEENSTPLFLQANNKKDKEYNPGGINEEECECDNPGEKNKSKGEGKGLAKGKGKGPIGTPDNSPYKNMNSPIEEAMAHNLGSIMLQEKAHLDGKGLGLKGSVKRPKVNSVFGKLFRKSVRTLVSEGYDLRNPETLDLAIGNAAVSYAILESLNTMNIFNSVEEKNSIMERLLK